MSSRFYRVSRYQDDLRVNPTGAASSISKNMSKDFLLDIEPVQVADQKKDNTQKSEDTNNTDRFEYQTNSEWNFLDPYHRFRNQWTRYESVQNTAHPRSIVIAYDGTPQSQPALLYGLAWSKHYHARVHVVRLITSALEELGQTLIDSNLKNDILKMMSYFPPSSYFQQYPPQSSTISAYRDTEDKSEALIQTATKLQANLLFLGKNSALTEGKDSLGRVTEHVLKNASCPVLIAHETVPAFPPKSILVPCDGTPFSYRALAYGIMLAEDLRCPLEVFHVSENETLEAEAHGKTRLLIEGMNWRSVSHDLVSASGSIHETLSRHAQKMTEPLLIMGSHRLDEVHTLENSVAYEVVRNTTHPILIVHPE